MTSPAPERGWIRTHSCGVAFLCFGLELGVGFGELGFGLGELGFGLGVVVELGVGVVDDEVLDGDEDVAAEVEDVEGLDEGLLLSDLRADADVLGETDLLVLLLADLLGVADELADLLDVADELAELNGDAEELASAAAGSCLAASVLAAESTVLFGMSGHAELMIG